MTNKVKPFYIKITDDMTPQMVQDAFDKCVDAGAVAEECIADTDKKYNYQDAYHENFNYFGVSDYNETYLTDDHRNFGDRAQEINLDQLDEWLGLEVEEEWEVLHGEQWIPCIRLGKDIYGHHAYQLSDGEFMGEFNGTPNLSDFRKPETPEQKAERERIENGKAIYDLMSSIEMNHDIAGKPNTWAELRDEWQSVYIQLAESIGYRKQ